MAQDSKDELKISSSFRTVEQLRSLREERGNKSPEQLKASAANTLYYKASPLDDCGLEELLEYMDKFAEERDAQKKQWWASDLSKLVDCKVPDTEEISQHGSMKKITPSLDFEGVTSDKLTYADDIMMENLLRARVDGAKERVRIRKYKKHMKQFLKVYQILKGKGLDYEDAIKMVHAPSVREAYSCGLKGNNESDSFWELSRMALPIKMETFGVNRGRLLHDIAPKFTKALVVMKGGEDIYLYDSGEKYPFRQEPFFLWTFAANEPNLWGLLDCWSGKAILLCPREESSDLTVAALKEKYEIEHVAFVDQIHEIISEINPTDILILSGTNPDSGRRFSPIELKTDVEINDKILYEIISELRVCKSHFELDLMRYANRISSLAHRLMMKRISADSIEYQAEALFKFFVHFVGGCCSLSYAPICASGRNCSDPNYSGNGRMIKCEDNIIFDMGASYYGYCSSIACTVPASGMFNYEQKTIYNIVLQTRNAALDVIKAGVFWSEIHDHAMRALLSGLKGTGIVDGDIEEMLASGVSTIFMPFGIGHSIGLDKFDTGGLADLEKRKATKEPHLAQLRTTRVLKPGMVMALHVGCYFNVPNLRRALVDPNLKRFFVKEHLERFISVGGVCIKDNVAVNHQGYEMLTNVPRTVEEIQDWLAGKYDAKKAEFELEVKVKKDELWIGSAKNPCLKTASEIGE